VRFDQVWFRYARRAGWALRAVDAVVEPGATVVVLGRNGAGKSTLLQLAAGVLRPVRGAVRGRPRIVGWVPERFPAEQPFTAEQYLRRMAALRGLRGAAPVEHWIDRLGLAEHRHTRLSDLSKGTAQKVGLAQALLVPPGLLVLDEPWEGLDSVARTLIPQLVAEVTAAGGAVLVSDHRGEIAGLPEAIRWSVTDSTVRSEATSGTDAAEVVIEVAVRDADADATVARLRAEGHRILRVRVAGASVPAPVPNAAAIPVPNAAAIPVPDAAGTPVLDAAAIPVPNVAGTPAPGAAGTPGAEEGR
jgi:ABC-type Mn2+/Zn2+ transport system ATPase subunit